MDAMPACGHGGCEQRSSVIYRATSERPIPRCWDHAPRLHEGIALGWLDSPSRDPLTLQTQTRTLNTTTDEGEQQT